MIRPAKNKDLELLMPIYAAARRWMCENNNPTQWAGGYPTRELLESDLKKGQLYVCERAGRLCGAFVLAEGEEPTYAVIENGAWKNDLPYATIHRVASDGRERGIFAECLAFCRGRWDTLRIDTHFDNHIMQRLCA